jgi:hypothetical protein
MTKPKRSRPGRGGGSRKPRPTAPSGFPLRARQCQRADGRSENFDAWFERIGKHFDDVLVTLKYEKPAVAAIRAVPSWTRWWDATSKVWRIHPGYAERLAADFGHLGYTVYGEWAIVESQIGAGLSPGEGQPMQLAKPGSCAQKA